MNKRIELEEPNRVVVFKDKGFEKAIRDLFNLKGEIQWKDVGYIEKLSFVDSIREDSQDIYNVTLTEKINSIEDLQWFVNVVNLAINFGDPGEPWIFGDLKDILPLKRLLAVDLSGSIIKGDVAILKDLVQLEDVTLTGLEIYGELKVFKDFTNLTCLYICDTIVEGDLKDIKNLTNLETLVLSFSKFTGDLSEICHLSKLKEISINESEISGNISAFENLLDLEYFEVSENDITGDVKSLQKLLNLKEVDLSLTNIIGDISVFEDKKKLKELNIYETEITGDVKVLKGLVDLKVLDLSYSEVCGSVKELHGLKNFKEFDLEESNIIGAVAKVSELEDDTYGVNKEHAHQRALELVPEDFFWDCGDELAPFGSDEGDTALSEFREWRVENPIISIAECIIWTIESVSEKSIGFFGKDILDPNLIKRQITDTDFNDQQYIFTVDASVIATGFGQLVDEGKIDVESKPFIQLSIDRQKVWAKLSFNEDFLFEYLGNLLVLERVLKLA